MRPSHIAIAGLYQRQGLPIEIVLDYAGNPRRCPPWARSGLASYTTPRK